MDLTSMPPFSLILAILALQMLGGLLVSQRLLARDGFGDRRKRLGLALIWLLPLLGGLLVWARLHRRHGARGIASRSDDDRRRRAFGPPRSPAGSSQAAMVAKRSKTAIGRYIQHG